MCFAKARLQLRRPRRKRQKPSHGRTNKKTPYILRPCSTMLYNVRYMKYVHVYSIITALWSVYVHLEVYSSFAPFSCAEPNPDFFEDCFRHYFLAGSVVGPLHFSLTAVLLGRSTNSNTKRLDLWQHGRTFWRFGQIFKKSWQRWWIWICLHDATARFNGRRFIYHI